MTPRCTPTASGNTTPELFRKAAARVACALGSPWGFAFAVLLVVAWAIAGPFVHYSETWQLLINTGTTIGTFLMLFLLQCSQNRDTKAIHIKLDELLRAIEGARTGLALVGDLSDEEIDKLEGEFRALASAARLASGAETDLAVMRVRADPSLPPGSIAHRAGPLPPTAIAS